MTIKTFISTDKKELSYRVWPLDQPRGLVQIAHGMAEHIDRYDDFARFLNDQGYLVFGNDHRGHGRNILEEKGFFADQGGWDQVVDDLLAVQAPVRQAWPGLDLVLVGHSMGSFLARTLAIRQPDQVDRLVLVGTGQGFGLAQALFRRLVLWIKQAQGGRSYSDFLNRRFNQEMLKKFKNPRTPYDWLNRDEAAVDRYLADPLCGFAVTNQFFLDLLQGLELVSAKETMVKLPQDLPILIVSGDQDPVGNFGRALEDLQRELNSLELSPQLILYPGMRHEILLELGKERVYQDILNFIDFTLK